MVGTEGRANKETHLPVGWPESSVSLMVSVCVYIDIRVNTVLFFFLSLHIVGLKSGKKCKFLPDFKIRNFI